MINFLMTFLGVVIGLTTGVLIMNNELDLTTRIFLIVILILAAIVLIDLLYRNYKVKLEK